MSKPYLVSRVTVDGTSTPLTVCPSRTAANEYIAKLEAADPKGSLIFYSRVEIDTKDRLSNKCQANT